MTKQQELDQWRDLLNEVFDEQGWVKSTLINSATHDIDYKLPEDCIVNISKTHGGWTAFIAYGQVMLRHKVTSLDDLKAALSWFWMKWQDSGLDPKADE